MPKLTPLILLCIGLGLAACQARPPQANHLPATATSAQPALPLPAVSLSTNPAAPAASTPANPAAPAEAPASPIPGAAPSPAAGRTETSSLMGVELHGYEAGQTLDLAYGTGAAWVRRNGLLWAGVEPNKGDRLWDPALEKELRTAAERGVKMILIIRNTPSWARKFDSSACGPAKKAEFDAFASFVQSAVARYSQPPYNVKYWEIWNEPDVGVNPSDFPFGCWGDTDDPYYGGEYYAKMLKAVYPAVKAADPAAQVLIGGLLLDCNPNLPGVCTDPRPPRFLEGILQAGGASFFDGISFHAYDYYEGVIGQYGNKSWSSHWNTTGPVVLAKAAYLQSILDSYGVAGKSLLNTESAVLNATGKACDAGCQETKAYYIAQVYSSALAARLEANVWFSVLGWRDSGLLGGPPDFTPQPAYQAYLFASSQLSGLSFVQSIETYPGVRIYELAGESRRMWVAWSLDGAEHPVSLPAAPLAAWDALGNQLPVTGPDISLTIKPVYIQWSH